MNSNQRIVLVSELFYPEESATAYLLTRIADELSRQFKMIVITGPESYEGRTNHNSKKPLVAPENIFRTWVPRFNKNSINGRVLRFLLLTFGLAWKACRKSRSGDIVFAVTNPAPLIVALAIVCKVKKVKLVILVHDVFPENAAATGIIRGNSYFYSILKKIFDWAYQSADSLITIGRDMSEVISRKIHGDIRRITLIENWADEPMLERISRDRSLIVSMGLSGKIVIQYAGNIGRAQGLLEFVDLLSAVQNDDIRYVFRGSGALTAALRSATNGRMNFILEGSYLRSEQSQVLGACDISLVILARDMYGLGVPSKTYNILASGKPVLFLGPKDSEVYRLIKSHDIGWAFDWSEADQMLNFISNLSMRDLPVIEACGNNARKLAETSFSEAGQLAKFSSFFHSFQRSAK
jgi:glycosyltransferase involved in cell wall biosynthesis